jgi:hypothetical protein
MCWASPGPQRLGERRHPEGAAIHTSSPSDGTPFVSPGHADYLEGVAPQELGDSPRSGVAT